MKGHAIQPIAMLDRRMPRAGKIKLGAKTEKAMKKLEQFRFLSPFKDCIEAIAAQYGGKCIPYHDDAANPKDQFEVYTTSDTIEVGLMPDGLEAAYEMWGGGMRQRTCDGVTCSMEVPDGDDYAIVEERCICMGEGTFRCKPKLRITVILPDVPLRGAWLLETGSWFAQSEMPGMFDLIAELGKRGQMTKALLSIEKRTDVKFGRGGKPIRRNYVVPVLSMADTPMALMSGDANMRALVGGNQASGGVATPQLGSGTPVAVRGNADHLLLDAGIDGSQDVPHVPSYDDDIAEAELVDPEWDEIEQGWRSDADQFGLDPERFIVAMHAQIQFDSKGVGVSDDERKKRGRAARAKMLDGSIEPLGISGDGKIQWRK